MMLVHVRARGQAHVFVAKRSRNGFGSYGSESKMPACRLCRSVYPEDQFIRGNGPRYQICVRCGVAEGIVDADEVPQLYSDDISIRRLSVFGRRWMPWFWLGIGWFVWIILFQGLELWTTALLLLLLLSTLGLPVLHLLRTPRFNAELRKLTP